jgi:hypothetical protein
MCRKIGGQSKKSDACPDHQKVPKEEATVKLSEHSRTDIGIGAADSQRNGARVIVGRAKSWLMPFHAVPALNEGHIHKKASGDYVVRGTLKGLTSGKRQRMCLECSNCIRDRG